MVNLFLDSSVSDSRNFVLQMQSRFGSSLAILDINLDGFNDLAVGAPSMTYSMLGYNVSLERCFSNLH